MWFGLYHCQNEELNMYVCRGNCFAAAAQAITLDCV